MTSRGIAPDATSRVASGSRHAERTGSATPLQ
jgi:hypothetical protein